MPAFTVVTKDFVTMAVIRSKGDIKGRRKETEMTFSDRGYKQFTLVIYNCKIRYNERIQ